MIYITSTASYGLDVKEEERERSSEEVILKQQPWVTLQCVIIYLSAAQMILTCFQLFIHTPKFNKRQDLKNKQKI